MNQLFGMWRRVTGLVVSDFSKEGSASIFMG